METPTKIREKVSQEKERERASERRESQASAPNVVRELIMFVAVVLLAWSEKEKSDAPQKVGQVCLVAQRQRVGQLACQELAHTHTHSQHAASRWARARQRCTRAPIWRASSARCVRARVSGPAAAELACQPGGQKAMPRSTGSAIVLCWRSRAFRAKPPPPPGAGLKPASCLFVGSDNFKLGASERRHTNTHSEGDPAPVYEQLVSAI